MHHAWVVRPFTHGTDGHIELFLLHSLPEELLRDSLGPVLIIVPRLCRVAQISAVHQVLQHLQTVDTRVGLSSLVAWRLQAVLREQNDRLEIRMCCLVINLNAQI